MRWANCQMHHRVNALIFYLDQRPANVRYAIGLYVVQNVVKSISYFLKDIVYKIQTQNVVVMFGTTNIRKRNAYEIKVFFYFIFSYITFILGQYYAIEKLKQSNNEVNALNKFSLYENFKDISVYIKNQ